MISGRDEQQRRGPRAGPVGGGQTRGAAGHQRDDERVQAGELPVWEKGAAPRLPQLDTGGVAGDVAGAGTRRRQPGYKGRRPGGS